MKWLTRRLLSRFRRPTVRLERLPFRPKIDTLEDRVVMDAVPAYALGSGPDERPEVKLYDASGSLLRTIDAFEESFTGGVRTALGDLTGDGIDDVVVGAGPGGGPRVRAFNGRTGGIIVDFFAYDSSFRNGVNAAVGSLGQGQKGIVTGADVGGAPHVRVFSSTGQDLQSFFAFDSTNRGGVSVAFGTTKSGRPAIVAGNGPGGSPEVAVFDLETGNVDHRFRAYDLSFRGGVQVATGEVNGDEVADLVIGAGPGGGPHVAVFDGKSGQSIHSFWAGEMSDRSGVSISTRSDGLLSQIGANGSWFDVLGKSLNKNQDVPSATWPTESIWEIPAVRVEAVDPNDPSAGGVGGFRVHRSGTTGTTKLTYELFGNAKPGVDYILPSGELKIGDGNR